MCPHGGGALKPVAGGRGDAWVHLTCAVWHPQVNTRNLINMSDIDISHVPLSAWGKVCYCCCAYVVIRSLVTCAMMKLFHVLVHVLIVRIHLVNILSMYHVP